MLPKGLITPPTVGVDRSLLDTLSNVMSCKVTIYRSLSSYMNCEHCLCCMNCENCLCYTIWWEQPVLYELWEQPVLHELWERLCCMNCENCLVTRHFEESFILANLSVCPPAFVPLLASYFSSLCIFLTLLWRWVFWCPAVFLEEKNR